MKPIAFSVLALIIAALFVLPFERPDPNSESTLIRIARTGELVIGYRSDAMPLSFENMAGQPAGYSIDLCRRFAERIRSHLGRPDIRARFVRIAANSGASAVGSGGVDIDCSSAAVTTARRPDVSFSMPTVAMGGGALSLRDGDVRKVRDLDKKKVGVVRSDFSGAEFKGHLLKQRVAPRVVPVANHQEGMRQLAVGAIDALVGDQTSLIGQLYRSATPRDYQFTEDGFAARPRAWILRKSDLAFRRFTNQTLAALYRDGEHDRLHDAWLGRLGIGRPGLIAAAYEPNLESNRESDLELSNASSDMSGNPSTAPSTIRQRPASEQR